MELPRHLLEQFNTLWTNYQEKHPGKEPATIEEVHHSLAHAGSVQEAFDIVEGSPALTECFYLLASSPKAGDWVTAHADLFARVRKTYDTFVEIGQIAERQGVKRRREKEKQPADTPATKVTKLGPDEGEPEIVEATVAEGLASLPPELLAEILKKMSLEDLGRAGAASRTLRGSSADIVRREQRLLIILILFIFSS